MIDCLVGAHRGSSSVSARRWSPTDAPRSRRRSGPARRGPTTPRRLPRAPPRPPSPPGRGPRPGAGPGPGAAARCPGSAGPARRRGRRSARRAGGPARPRRPPRPGPRWGWGGAGRRAATRVSALRGAPPTSGAAAAASRAATRAGTAFATSSARALAQPKRVWRVERCPTIASRVFTARYPSRPGTPATAPHSSGATTASEVFSATDSRAARARPSASRADGSRPQSDGSRRRAAPRSPAASSPASAEPSPASDRPPSTAHVAHAVTSARRDRRPPGRALGQRAAEHRAPDEHAGVRGTAGARVRPPGPFEPRRPGPEHGDRVAAARVAQQRVDDDPDQQPRRPSPHRVIIAAAPGRPAWKAAPRGVE